MSARDDPRTAQSLGKFFDVVRAAEMMAKGAAAATHPRDVIAERLRRFVAAFDREHAWPSSGDYSEHSLRVRALAVADVLAAQGKRMRMPK
jgi:hypothetical protein